MLAFVKLRITFSIAMYTMCVTLCLFNALRRGVGALQITSIIIIIIIIIKTLLQEERRETIVRRGRGLGWGGEGGCLTTVSFTVIVSEQHFDDIPNALLKEKKKKKKKREKKKRATFTHLES